MAIPDVLARVQKASLSDLGIYSRITAPMVLLFFTDIFNTKHFPTI